MAKHEASHEDAIADAARDVLIDGRILDTVRQRSDCYVDDLCCAGRDLTRNQIVPEVNRVSRRNQVPLTLAGKEHDRVALPGQFGKQ